MDIFSFLLAFQDSVSFGEAVSATENSALSIQLPV